MAALDSCILRGDTIDSAVTMVRRSFPPVCNLTLRKNIVRTVITEAHPWTIFYIVFVFYLTWASALVLKWIDIRAFYLAALGKAAPSKDPEYDPLGFGQVSLTLLTI
jgi:hypothetical protein